MALYNEIGVAANVSLPQYDGQGEEVEKLKIMLRRLGSVHAQEDA